ncbi:lanthionine synthetase LanC family protein [Microlunatus sp. Gsoil 973]|uniref:lanthionine synthetase LanC family protein n=1 Tax=Microlunatus sp. Gsoil 973 TaxID=2672569 RepID=UPI0012B47AB1|nr:lanthionine synthetase LanC family protein [Microlunatus sp. Gsoil 973]QGN32015.1 protein kinase [Microlunatus sp. Gsoil 973]
MEQLRSDIRELLDWRPGDFVVTNPTARARSLLVDEATARVISSWREATSVADVAAWAVDAGLRLDRHDINELHEKLVALGYLVSTAASSPQADRLVAGTQLDGITVGRLAHEMPDKHVYAGVDPQGERVAIKIAAHATDAATRSTIEREATILSDLSLPAVPSLTARGDFNGRAYIAIEWRDGVDALTHANTIRSEAGSPAESAAPLRDLVATIFEAYAQLHQAGIAHADIHPRNILVGEGGCVSLIDFELATTRSGGGEPSAPRGGVPYFFDRHYSKALLEGRRPPGADIDSDLHGLLALAYLLMTGSHYLPFRLDRGQFYRQISDGGMQPFALAAGWTWPSVEEILATGLNSGGRSAEDLATALRRASLEDVAVGVTPTTPWPADFISTFRHGGVHDAWPLPAPSGCIHHGAAGIAFALLSDPAADAGVLADAAMWSHRSVRAIDARDPTAGGVLDPALARSWSLHYGAAGVQLVRALVACAQGAGPELDRAADSFRRCADDLDDESTELASGAAGWLLGAALLCEAIPGASAMPARASLIQRGDAVLTTLSRQDFGGLPVGIAHGIAGVAFGALQWARVRAAAPPGWAIAICEELGGRQNETCDAGWIAPTEWDSVRAERFASSWCNGSSGLALLFCAAYECTQRADFLRFATTAGQMADRAKQNGASLCCGDAGRALALAAVGRVTGEDKWVGRARENALTAATARQTIPTSLYKGALGARVAQRLLRDPRSARFPLFELAGWPSRWTHGPARTERWG